VSINLDHTIVRARDRRRSAQFLASLLGLEVGADAGPLVPVQINPGLALEFDDRHEFAAAHYAFRVDPHTFERVMAWLQASSVPFGSGPEHGWDRRAARAEGTRTVYVCDPDGHSYELIAPDA
jgi:catechol 2,3-dioxygenase-like lactoylglutathione lyase family enzyme